MRRWKNVRSMSKMHGRAILENLGRITPPQKVNCRLPNIASVGTLSLYCQKAATLPQGSARTWFARFGCVQGCFLQPLPITFPSPCHLPLCVA
jgi:hypothetical protein